MKLFNRFSKDLDKMQEAFAKEQAEMDKKPVADKADVHDSSVVDLSYCYTVYDKVAGVCVGMFVAPNDATVIRTSLPTILMDFALRDIEILCVGLFNTKTGFMSGGFKPRVVPTDSYLFPHSRLSDKSDNLPLEEVEKSMHETKEKFLAQQRKAAETDPAMKKEAVNE